MASEWLDLLSELGWSRAELARRLGVHPMTVSRWREAPGYAMAYLRLAVGVKRLWEEIDG